MSLKLVCILNSPKIGGAEKSTLELIQNLPQEIEVALISSCADMLFSRGPHTYIKMDRFKKTTNFFALIRYLSNTIYQSLKIYKKIQLRKPDIIYTHSAQSLPHGIILKFIIQTKLICHLRDRPRQSLLYQICLELADRLICISEYIYDIVNVSAKKKIVIPGAISISDHKISYPNLLPTKISSQKSATQYIAIISHLVPWKNHLLFLEFASLMLKRQKDLHFIIFGDDLFGENPSYTSILYEKIEHLGIRQHVSVIAGEINLTPYLKFIQLVVHTAKGEPFGRAIVESMAMEKPVIALNNGGPKEIIEHGLSGFLIEEINFASEASKIALEILKDSEYSQRVGQNARKRIKDKFDIQNRISQFTSVLYDVIDE